MRRFTVEEAEDLVYGFWLNTPEARAAREREENEKKSNIEKWATEVASKPCNE